MEVKQWFSQDSAQHFKKFIENAIVSYADQLCNNFLDPKGNDLSAVIRGRLYAYKEIMGMLDELETYDRMKTELLVLENEGFVATPDEGMPN